MSQQSISLFHVVQQPTEPSHGKPPLLILLHGVGSNEDDLIGLASYLDGRFLIVSIRAPLTLRQGGYGWYEIEWTADGIKHNEQGAIDGQAAAELAIDELIAAYGSDPARTYLMGFSQGAIMSLAIALTNPEKIAGAVIMSGRLLPHVAAKVVRSDRLTGFPLLVVHGTLDNVLPIAEGRQIEQFVKETPIALTYHEYAMGHTVTQESLRDITTWLTEQLDSHHA